MWCALKWKSLACCNSRVLLKIICCFCVAVISILIANPSLIAYAQTLVGAQLIENHFFNLGNRDGYRAYRRKRKSKRAVTFPNDNAGERMKKDFRSDFRESELIALIAGHRHGAELGPRRKNNGVTAIVSAIGTPFAVFEFTSSSERVLKLVGHPNRIRGSPIFRVVV